MVAIALLARIGIIIVINRWLTYNFYDLFNDEALFCFSLSFDFIAFSDCTIGYTLHL